MKKKPITESELLTLQEAYKHSKKGHFRNRCHAVELYSRGKSIVYISDLLKVRPEAVYIWLTRWDSLGIAGLMILKGRGIKAPLDVLLSDPTRKSIDLIKKK